MNSIEGLDRNIHLDYLTFNRPLNLSYEHLHEELEHFYNIVAKEFVDEDVKWESRKNDKIIRNSRFFYIRLEQKFCSVQVHGQFFAEFGTEALDKLRHIIKKLNRKITYSNRFGLGFKCKDFDYLKFKIVRCDVAQDFQGITPDFFESPLNGDYKANFKYNMTRYWDNTNFNKQEYTGFSLFCTSSSIACYRKDLERRIKKGSTVCLMHIQDAKTKKWHPVENLVDSIPITRFECRALQADVAAIANILFYDSKVTEHEFCKIFLSDFYKRKKFKIPHPTRPNTRWRENNFWKSLFMINGDCDISFRSLTGMKKSDIKNNPYIVRKANITKAANVLADLKFHEQKMIAYNLVSNMKTEAEHALEKADMTVKSRIEAKEQKEITTLNFYRLLDGLENGKEPKYVTPESFRSTEYIDF